MDEFARSGGGFVASMRLDKFFSSQSLASRKEVKILLRQGLITVNGTPAAQPEQKIDPEQDCICLQGREVSFRPYLYLMLNKPQGVVSATNDRSCTTVLDLVPPEWYRPDLFPAGRLDKDTTGFVLLTNDGDFAHRMLAPKSHVKKVYHAQINVPITEKQMAQFAEGVVLKDGYRCLPAEMKILEEGGQPVVEIVLREGKYHQIKRMIAAVGGHVLRLKRVQIGELKLDVNLPEGQVREILHKELCTFL